MPASAEKLFPLISAATHMATTAICNRKTTATSSPRPHTPQHHGIGATPWHQEQPSPSPARFISIADFSPTRIQTRKPAWSTVTNPLRGNLVPADHSAAPRGSTFTSQRIYHSSQLSHLRFHVPVLLVSHPMTDTPSHVFDQTGHEGRQTRIGRRVYCRCVQSVHGPNRAWGTGFVEILFTTQPSTISRGSIHGA